MYHSTARTRLVAVFTSIVIVLFEVLPVTMGSTTMISVTGSLASTAAISKSVNQVKSFYSMFALYRVDNSDEHNISVIHASAVYSSTRNSKDAVAKDIFDDKKSSSLSKNNNAKKFVHSSIRIEEDVLNALQREAQRRDISFNSLVNKTLKNYVTSEMYFEQLGFILVSKDFLRKTFSKIDEKHIEEFGIDIGLTIAREYISYFSGEVNDKTLIQFLDIWFRRFQFFQHRIEQDAVEPSDANALGEKRQKQQVHFFMVIHDVNMNFSLVIRSMLEGLVEPITKSPVKFRDITSSSIIFLIKI
jgi:predicted HicB family RNase H-like nuclease